MGPGNLQGSEAYEHVPVTRAKLKGVNVSVIQSCLAHIHPSLQAMQGTGQWAGVWLFHCQKQEVLRKAGAELACLPWKDLMTLPLYSPGPDKEPKACEGRRLVCALRVVLKTLVFHTVAQPGNWTVTKLDHIWSLRWHSRHYYPVS